MKIKEFPTLYGISSTGKKKFWTIAAIEAESTVRIVITHGYMDGKAVETLKTVYKGKNTGKINETTPFEQACLEAQSAWTKKKDEKYTEYLDQAESSDIILPMLAMKFADRKHDITYPCYVQPKLNGVRCLAKKLSNTEIRYTSRNGKEYTTLDHLTPGLLKMLSIGDILDGEIYVHDWTFQEIIRNVKKKRHTSKQLEYWVYDMAEPSMLFRDRLRYIRGCFEQYVWPKAPPPIVLTETPKIYSEADVYNHHKKYVADGFEGVIIRNSDGLYKFDHRSKDLQKYKSFIDEEFTVVGGFSGEGLEEDCVIFMCKTVKGREFKVRPRGSREVRKEWLDDLDNIIGKKLTVRYQELSEDKIPIFPVGISIRDYE